MFLFEFTSISEIERSFTFLLILWVSSSINCGLLSLDHFRGRVTIFPLLICGSTFSALAMCPCRLQIFPMSPLPKSVTILTTVLCFIGKETLLLMLSNSSPSFFSETYTLAFWGFVYECPSQLSSWWERRTGRRCAAHKPGCPVRPESPKELGSWIYNPAVWPGRVAEQVQFLHPENGDDAHTITTWFRGLLGQCSVRHRAPATVWASINIVFAPTAIWVSSAALTNDHKWGGWEQ